MQDDPLRTPAKGKVHLIPDGVGAGSVVVSDGVGAGVVAADAAVAPNPVSAMATAGARTRLFFMVCLSRIQVIDWSQHNCLMRGRELVVIVITT